MELRRIVAGTDYSEPSLQAVRWTARHLVGDGEMVLVHVLELPQPPVFLRRLLPAPEELRETLRVGAESRMRELAASFGSLRLWPELREGDAPAVIADTAREYEADLIVVGEHGTRRGMRGLLGTTAERLLRCAPVPVLVARDLPDHAPASLLAPLDGSAMDARVLAWSRLLHERFGTRVTACHAIDLMQAYGRVRTISAASRIGEIDAELRAGTRDWIRQRLAEAGFAEDEAGAEVIISDPRSGIPAIAERSEADVIVMGARGAGAVERALLGSVTSAVLESTSFSVLVVVGEDR
jgi:nucleotide-binding universal stress UspA family protein